MIMPPPKRARQAEAVSSTQPFVSCTFRIPCFAHQQLDPARFPEGVGVAIGGPLSWASVGPRHGGGQGAWEDSDDGENARDVDESQVKATEKTPAVKRRRESMPKSKPDKSYKRMKVAGGRPAVAKKVTANLDSDDEVIMRMKNAKFLEKDIAQYLVNEGRIAYNPKTIGTRHARIMRAIQKENDKLLDADLTDWHEGDDDALEQAVARAEDDVKRIKAAVEAKKWRIVADELKKIRPVVDFSQYACRNRYEALMEGTAKPTPESIPDPDEKIKKRIESRREKLKRIEEDALQKEQRISNLQGNAWTSRAVKYF